MRYSTSLFCHGTSVCGLRGKPLEEASERSIIKALPKKRIKKKEQKKGRIIFIG